MSPLLIVAVIGFFVSTLITYQISTVALEEASQGIHQVSNEISDVLDETHKTGTSLSHVQEAIEKMIAAQTIIADEIQKFLKNVQQV